MDIPGASANRKTIKWILSFLFFITMAYFLSKDAVFVSRFNQAMVYIQIRISSMLLNLLGFAHEISQTVIVTPSRQFVVAESCSGLFVFLLFSAAVLSFPASWQARLEGLSAAALTLIGLNIIRIVMIVILSSRFPESFWAFHMIAGQILVICGMAGLFLLWLIRIQTNTPFSKYLLQKDLFSRLVLFAAGYGSGFLLYNLFLKSPFGIMVADLVKEHSWMILDLIREYSDVSTHRLKIPAIGFNPGCLSSPVLVVIFAALTAWPCSWKKKLVIVIIGFVPLFYFYHLFRAVMTALSFSLGTAREHSIVYQCYGQFVLAAAAVVCFWVYQFTAINSGKKDYAVKSVLPGILAGGVASFAGGKIVTDFLLPETVERFFPGAAGIHDPQLSIHTMAYFQFFIFYALVGSTPGKFAKKAGVSMAGLPPLMGIVPLLAFMIETFHLSPHEGMLKGFIIGFPLLLYYLLHGKRIAGK